ncbi:MAG: helix-turn-helix domain-containing protein [Gammaproteobacteria bacterium]|nr:helix-turn-helix domain-containing protein [Gammaproteobacteria bacterium]MCY4282803.1 helix-turn-helix domain-containing protein [Gammaproteobacteria bacterium]MCY4339373.1 helix-turn-helix domain-containing protein [Gammaproteobacteria bacterium]
MSDFLLPKGPISSTADVGEREQLEYWIDMICDEFVQLDCTVENRQDFKGKIRGSKLGDIWVSEVDADAQHVIRSKKQIAKSTEKEFLLSLQLEDVGFINQDGRSAQLHPGDFALYDSTRPYFLHFDRPFRQIVLQLPYDTLAEQFVRPENITALRVSAQTAVGALASQFIQSVAGRLDVLSAQERGVINHHIIELVALALGSMTSLRDLDGQSLPRTALLERIKQYIEINIRDPQLTPAQVAGHHHISERYQRMLFASTGTTASKYILNKRLELCREALANPALRDHSITQIAFSYGFNDAAHFSRRFKEHYGVCPKECRENPRTEVVTSGIR